MWRVFKSCTSTNSQADSPIKSPPPRYQQNPRRNKLSDFKMLQKIGQGSFGTVNVVQDLKNYRVYAMKTIKKGRVPPKYVESEKNALQRATWYKIQWTIKLFSAFQDKENLYFITEFCPGGDLLSLLMKKVRFSDEETQFYASEMAAGIDHLHKIGILHCDIKPENVLLDIQGHVKIADFGLCKVFKPGQDPRQYVAITKSVAGTKPYIAPEVLRYQKYSPASDWYSLGVVMLEMATGRNDFRILWESMPCNKTHSPEPFTISPEVKNTIQCFLYPNDETKRPGAQGGLEDIKSIPFFRDVDWKNIGQGPAPNPVISSPIQSISVTSSNDDVHIQESSDEWSDWGRTGEWKFMDFPHGLPMDF